MTRSHRPWWNRCGEGLHLARWYARHPRSIRGGWRYRRAHGFWP